MALFNNKPRFAPPTGPVPTPVQPLPELDFLKETHAAPAVQTAPAASSLPPLTAPAMQPATPAASALPPLTAPAMQPAAPAASALPPLTAPAVQPAAPAAFQDPNASFGALGVQRKLAILTTTPERSGQPAMLPLSGRSGGSAISSMGGLTGTLGLAPSDSAFPGSMPASSSSDAPDALPALLPLLPTRNTPLIQIFRTDEGYMAKHVTKRLESKGSNEYEAFMNLLSILNPV